MPTLICPYCDQKITLPYRDNVSCTKCGQSLDVRDDGNGENITYFEPDIKRERAVHYSTSTVADAPPRIERRYNPPSPGSTRNAEPSSIPRVTYRDIGGLDETIRKLDGLVNGPTRHPKVWKHLGGKKVRGILLSGPPGCGKTLLARVLPNTCSWAETTCCFKLPNSSCV